MKVINIIILFLTSLSPNMASAQNSYTKDQKEVYQTILSIGIAWTQNNLDTLEKYIHTDYMHTDVRGQILNRASWLAYVKDRKDKGVTNPDILFGDIQINIYDNFAFVTGINTFYGQAYTTNDNSNEVRKIRFTQVLKKENTVWKRIIFQATYIDSL